MQIHHWAKLSSTVPKIRCRIPIVVIRMVNSSASPYRRSCLAPGSASRSKIVLTWSRARYPAAMWNSDRVVRTCLMASLSAVRLARQAPASDGHRHGSASDVEVESPDLELSLRLLAEGRVKLIGGHCLIEGTHPAEGALIVPAAQGAKDGNRRE